MNKLIITLSTFLLIFPLLAQIPTATRVNFDGNTFQASEITLDLPMKEVKDYWDDFWDDRFDIDVDRQDRSGNSETYLAEQVSMASVSESTFDLWSKLTEVSDMRTQVALAISFGNNVSAGPTDYPKAYNQGADYLDEFRRYAYTTYYDSQIEEVTDQLDDVRDDKEDAVKDRQKSNRRIEKWQRKIEKYEERIAEERASIETETTTAANKAERIAELERRLSELQARKARSIQ